MRPVLPNCSDQEPQSLVPATQLQIDLPGAASLDDLDAAVLTAAVLLSSKPTTAVTGVWRELDGRPLGALQSGHLDVGCYTILTPALTRTDLVEQVRELPPDQALPLVRQARASGVDRDRFPRAVGFPLDAGVIVNTLHQPVWFGAAALPTARLVPAVATHNATTSPHLVHVDAHLNAAGQLSAPRSATLTVTFHPATTARFRHGWISGLRDGVAAGLASATPRPLSAGTVVTPVGAELLGLSPASLEDLLHELETPES